LPLLPPVSPTGKVAAAAATTKQGGKKMKLLTQTQEQRMRENGAINAALSHKDGKTEDFQPVVKLFCPWTDATWLLTELNPEDPDIAFGLCDLGMGFPEMGSVRLSELAAGIGPGGLRIERDLHFKPANTLRGYAEAAHREQHISD
jgi:DUF2958 family protein